MSKRHRTDQVDCEDKSRRRRRSHRRERSRSRSRSNNSGTGRSRRRQTRHYRQEPDDESYRRRRSTRDGSPSHRTSLREHRRDRNESRNRIHSRTTHGHYRRHNKESRHSYNVNGACRSYGARNQHGNYPRDSNTVDSRKHDSVHHDDHGNDDNDDYRWSHNMGPKGGWDAVYGASSDIVCGIVALQWLSEIADFVLKRNDLANDVNTNTFPNGRSSFVRKYEEVLKGLVELFPCRPAVQQRYKQQNLSKSAIHGVSALICVCCIVSIYLIGYQTILKSQNRD